MQNKNRDFCRLIALLLFVCIVITFLSSAFFIILNADHHCTGECCQTCEQISNCKDTIRKFGIGFPGFVFVTFACAVLLFYVLLSVYDDKKKENTLVQLKVRLNN